VLLAYQRRDTGALHLADRFQYRTAAALLAWAARSEVSAVRHPVVAAVEVVDLKSRLWLWGRP
jgi:hypothetical protein